MNKLTLRDKCILLMMILGLVTYAGYHFLWLPINAEIQTKTQQEQELKGKVGDDAPLKQQITQLQAQEQELTEGIDQHKLLQGGKSLNKEDFLTFLTDECTKNYTELVRFNDLGTKEDGGTWKAQFDFELRGNLMALNSVCQAMDQIGIRYSVGGFSLRQNNTHAYLTRFFDESTRLDWYKDDTPKPTESPSPDETIPETDSSAIQIPSTIPNFPETLPSEPPALTPAPTPEQMPQPSAEPKDDSITDRLDSLLKQTSGGNVRYKVVFLTNTENPSGNSKAGDIMLLNITVEFTMYSNPADLANSFLLSSPSEV